ncbi:PLXB2 protein, partial [Amia calva]|nr:PLXB2 protein [Amia calva]
MCTPPITSLCDAKLTNNFNKLLLVHETNGSLIMCGSLFRGICALLNLTDIEQQVYYSDNKGEKTYVVSTEETVSVVGVMSTTIRESENLTVFLVGKGYGSHDNSKLVSTRILQDFSEWVVFENIVEASSVQAISFVPKYRHDFRYSFTSDGFVYFLFSRTNGKNDNKNYTFISRLCENDTHYYSYTELQLSCSDVTSREYRKVQAAYITYPGKQLANSMTQSGKHGTVTAQDKVLFVVFSNDTDTSKGNISALCMYSLETINKKVEQIIEACYNNNGYIEGQQAVYTPYSSDDLQSHCNSNKLSSRYPCGADFLPSPMASMPAFAVSSEAVFTSGDQLTAVAVSVENHHTIAFLGSSGGEVYKVHLTNNSDQYDEKSVGNTRVNKNLFFDKSRSHIYITTEKKITQVPVQECQQRTDCQSCMAVKDPYCGWCVLEGRCTTKVDCSRAEESNHWLWSPRQQCVQITAFSPANLTRKTNGEVNLTVSPFPQMEDSEKLLCYIAGFQSSAKYRSGQQIACSLPDPASIPVTPENQDYVAVDVRLSIESVTLADGKYMFYDCSAAMKKAQNTPCWSCVTSRWGCQWDTLTYTCSESEMNEERTHIINHQEVRTKRVLFSDMPHSSRMAHPYVPSQEGLLCLPLQSQEHGGDTKRRAVTRRAGQCRRIASIQQQDWCTGEVTARQPPKREWFCRWWSQTIALSLFFLTDSSLVLHFASVLVTTLKSMEEIPRDGPLHGELDSAVELHQSSSRTDIVKTFQPKVHWALMLEVFQPPVCHLPGCVLTFCVSHSLPRAAQETCKTCLPDNVVEKRCQQSLDVQSQHGHAEVHLNVASGNGIQDLPVFTFKFFRKTELVLPNISVRKNTFSGLGAEYCSNFELTASHCQPALETAGRSSIVFLCIGSEFGVWTPEIQHSVSLAVMQSGVMTDTIVGTEDDTVPVSMQNNLWQFIIAYDRQTYNMLLYVKEGESGNKIDSMLNVTLYNCSFGREDCSLCKNADPQYNCVWCDTTKSCLYSKLCTNELQECPAPTIKNIIPLYGPLQGGIYVTIQGSNLGIKTEDIKSITVAGINCTQKTERYSVSTSIVCEIGSVPEPISGTVEVELQGGKKGTSRENFSYREPEPNSVFPEMGPKAGGTVITIKGKNLHTATKEDLNITVGNVVCTVVQFDSEIQCVTGEFQTSSPILSKKQAVTVKYGRNTTKRIENAFCFSENPKVEDYDPGSSFFCGGRNITVTGTGFNLTQSALMRVVASPKKKLGSDMESKQVCMHVYKVSHAEEKTDGMLRFLSPEVPKEYENYTLSIFIILDNVKVDLKETKKDMQFEYYPNPTFNITRLTIPQNSIISVTGQGFSKAMTASEAEAFVGDQPCKVTTLQDDKLYLDPPKQLPKARSRHTKRDTSSDLDVLIKFGKGEWKVGTVSYETKDQVPLHIIIPVVLIPMLAIIAISICCYRRKSQQAEREYEKVKHQLENLEESVRDRCKKEFTDLMIEMEDHTSDLSEARIPFLDYKTYTDRVFFLPSKDGANDVMITGKIDIPEPRRATVEQALNQFSNLLNSKPFLINFIRTLEGRPDFNARARGYFASLLTVALHGKLEYYTDIMRTLLLELMEQYVHSKNPKLMLRRSETVVERMLCNWMSICLYQYLKDSAGEPLYKLFKAIKHQVEKGPVDAVMKKAKYTLNDTGLLGDDVEYSTLTLQVLVHGEGPDVTQVKVLNCDTISQVKEKIIDQVYKNLPYSQRPKADSVALEWRPGSTGQILSDLDLTSQKEGRWKRMNTLAHYNVRDNATLVLSRVLHPQQPDEQHQDNHEERNALLEDDRVFHLVRSVDELDEGKSKRGSMKDKGMTKAITEIYLTRLLSVKGTLQQFVDDFFRSVLCSNTVVPPAVKYFFDFLDEQAEKHENVDDETIHIWKTNSLPLRFWVNILKNPHFIFDVHVHEMVDASLSVIAQTFMDACTKSEHKLSRDSPSNKLLYAKEISSYKKMVDE